jgi:hypothetical protein
MLISRSRLATYAKHAKVTHVTNDITPCHEYKIVNVIQESSCNHTSILMSTFGCSEQASPISKGFTKIQINSHLVREITRQHDTREPQRQPSPTLP